jgi:PAS domain S-box-containing protein
MIVVSWSMVAAFALSMGAVQTLYFVRNRANTASLLAAVMSLGAAATALLEMGVAKTADPATTQTLLFFVNISIFALLVPMVWFVHIFLSNDRTWLLWTITGIWTLAMVVNVVMPGNLTFTSLDRLEQGVTAWGETWSQPVGDANPFRVTTDIATLLIILYVLDASVRSYRAGDRRNALVVGGAILFFIVLAGIHTPLVDGGIVKTPYMISWAFVAIAIALGAEIVDRASRSAALGVALRDEELRWRTLVENVELGVLGGTVDGNISYSNRFMEEMLGYGRTALHGHNISEFTPPGLRSEMELRLQRARIHGPPPRVEFPLVDAGGGIRHMRWSLVAVRGGGDRITGYIAICEDMTALKNAEQDLRDSERTIERFDRASFLVEIASGLAHDLNQPLAAILANAQAGRRMIEQDPPPLEEIAEILDDIAEDDMRAGSVIQSMRGLLQKGEMSSAEADLRELISKVRLMLEGDLRQAGIRLETDYPDDLPPVLVGKTEIQQVVMNLLVNAIRILRTEKVPDPVIAIGARREGSRIEVSVTDNGPGLDAEECARIFERFYTTRKDGLGMGLPISKRIVELHGGALACSSRPGAGATFTFSVPMSTAMPEQKNVA